ncbi:hypothetical protein J6590_007818 [Homalodisca vitripennis]|nr:hypothetical protein J6590_007818 [Homalodisca vitripennis]
MPVLCCRKYLPYSNTGSTTPGWAGAPRRPYGLRPSPNLARGSCTKRHADTWQQAVCKTPNCSAWQPRPFFSVIRYPSSSNAAALRRSTHTKSRARGVDARLARRVRVRVPVRVCSAGALRPMTQGRSEVAPSFGMGGREGVE